MEKHREAHLQTPEDVHRRAPTVGPAASVSKEMNCGKYLVNTPFYSTLSLLRSCCLLPHKHLKNASYIWVKPRLKQIFLFTLVSCVCSRLQIWLRQFGHNIYHFVGYHRITTAAVLLCVYCSWHELKSLQLPFFPLLAALITWGE